jgi:glyoxylase-like metal-dependent hydrolase (beta-lactamase superfamily II)
MNQPVECIQLGAVSVYLGAKSGKYPDGNQLVVRGSDTMVAFDTPLIANRLAEQLRAVDYVVQGHAHEDHLAGLHLIPNTPVQVHRADLAAAQGWDGMAKHYGYSPATLVTMKADIERDFHYVGRPDATAYDDGASWELGGGVRIRAIHMPGHTSGHCVLLVEPDDIAFIGDIDLTGFGPYYGDATSNLAAFRKTLIDIERLPARTWVTSHHKAVVRDREQFLSLLRAFAGKIDARDDAIVAAIGPEPKTFDQIAKQRFLYPQDYGPLWVNDVEHHTLRQHLSALQANGRVLWRDGVYCCA